MTIAALIADFAAAKDAWFTADPDGECEGSAWDAYIAAEVALFAAPCRTLDDVRKKATAIWDDPSLFDTLRSCSYGEEYMAAILLRSLIGEDFTTTCTQDGNWLARCLRTGLTASGATLDEAVAELRRLLSTRRAA